MKRIVSFLVACALVAGCAENQVKRDLAHAQLAQNYTAATATGAAFDPSSVCTGRPAFKTWVTFEFTPQSRIFRLPTDLNAAAQCVAIPAGAKAIEIHGGSKGGMTYYDLTAILPSVVFLDADYGVVRDLQRPNLKTGEGILSGLGVSAIIPLVDPLSAARHVVIYIHPDSTSREIDVHTGYQTIPVPFGPYGTVRARFFE